MDIHTKQIKNMTYNNGINNNTLITNKNSTDSGEYREKFKEVEQASVNTTVIDTNKIDKYKNFDLKLKKLDATPYRVEFIKRMLEGNILKICPMISYSSSDSSEENKELIHKDHNKKNVQCRDIRCILNKKLYNFFDVIKQIGGKLKYIKSGTTGHTFKGLIDETTYYAVKVVAYPKKEKYGDMYDIRRPENAELMMIKILSSLVTSDQTPHIVLPICTFNTSIKPFVYLPKKKLVADKRYAMFVKKYKRGAFYDHVSVLINEWCTGGDLLDYLKKHYKTFTTIHWKALFFQIISVLAVIQKEYPSFRHNDLKANNFLVQEIAIRNKNNYFKYHINGKYYLVPNIGFIIKLWDFDFACIPGIVDNSKVYADWTDQINIRPKKNRYYDIHYFFNTLTRKQFFPQILEDKNISKEIPEFIERIVPKEYKEGKNVAERGRILTNKEHTTPNKILKLDPFFEQFRYNNPKIKVV